MKILVTGGAGFIGSKFVIHALKLGHEITILDALTYAGLVENIDARARFVYGNVCDVALVDDLVSQADWIVHFAAETHVTRSIVSNRLFFETDVMGTQTICQAIVKHRETVKRFLHFSTSEVYGTAVAPLMNENHPLNPLSPYAAAKCGADRLVYSYWKTYGIPAVISRSFNVYGPRQHPEKVIPRFIACALMGEPLPVHGDGSAVRDFIHVDDVRRACMLLLESGKEGEVYNIASGIGVSVDSLARQVSSFFPGSVIQRIGDRPGQVDRHTGDAIKLRGLGWERLRTWDEGLSSTIDWYRNNGQWLRQMPFARIPVTTTAGRVEAH